MMELIIDFLDCKGLSKAAECVASEYAQVKGKNHPGNNKKSGLQALLSEEFVHDYFTTMANRAQASRRVGYSLHPYQLPQPKPLILPEVLQQQQKQYYERLRQHAALHKSNQVEPNTPWKHALSLKNRKVPPLKTNDPDEWSDDDDTGYRRVAVGQDFFNEDDGFEEFEIPNVASGEDPTTEDIEQLNKFLEDKASLVEKDNDDWCTRPPPDPPNDQQYEVFSLKIMHIKKRTGFEETKDYPIKLNGIIAGRYQIQEYLGSAAFSKAVQCLDLFTGQPVCIKIINNNKDFFDQSLDEIKLLTYINSRCVPDEKHILQLYDYFYHKEHLFLVCELLRDNLYEFYKYNRESGDELYFNMERLKKVTKQVLLALDYVHNLNLIHCDLKPENILIKSYSRCEVKVIDFGSSCFTTDHLSSYVQSRAYRAPEVMLGCKYNQKIDIWSLGCIIAELWTGNVLFLNDSIASLLARVNAIIGPFPADMLASGRHSKKYYTRTGVLYEQREGKNSGYCYLHPKKSSLRHRLKTDDAAFVDFISLLLRLRPEERPTARQALHHPWLADVV